MDITKDDQKGDIYILSRSCHPPSSKLGNLYRTKSYKWVLKLLRNLSKSVKPADSANIIKWKEKVNLYKISRSGRPRSSKWSLVYYQKLQNYQKLLRNIANLSSQTSLLFITKRAESRSRLGCEYKKEPLFFNFMHHSQTRSNHQTYNSAHSDLPRISQSDSENTKTLQWKTTISGKPGDWQNSRISQVTDKFLIVIETLRC